jgi:hypothetical protein
VQSEETSKGPVRGTQTFVGVMSSVWGRPSLTGLELLWRWLAGAPILALVCWQAIHIAATTVIDTAALEAMTVFQPVAAFATIRHTLAVLAPAVEPVAAWLLPIIAVAWIIAAGLGRTAVLRRFDRTLHARIATMLALGLLRAAGLTVFWLIWGWGVRLAGKIAITGPPARGGEPSVVLFCTFLICGTLLLYVLWGIVSWPLQLAPLLALMEDKGPLASLFAAIQAGPVGGKLLEVNLVMHIVKLALIVLAMVLSASPLAFATVATQAFFTLWWAMAILLYFAASDYFHVVRVVAYVRLWQSYKYPAKS